MSPTDEQLLERIAVFRHSLISRLLSNDLSRTDRLREFERIVTADHVIPGTSRTRIADSTLRDWIRAHRVGGFDALKPKKRIDAGETRALDPVLAEQLILIKEEDRDRSIRRVIELARERDLVGADMPVPLSTVHRLFQRHGLTHRGAGSTQAGVDRRRFAFNDAGELYMSDVMHGPTVAVDGKRRRKSYLIAFLDDATRVIPHAEFALSENTRSFLPVFRQAILRRGLPARLYVDNGSAFRSHQLAIVCAKLNVALIHATAYQPAGKGKIERFFRTVRAQLITRLTPDDTASLESLNRALAGWVEGEYHENPHRGLDNDTPMERWAKTSSAVRYPAADSELDELFLFDAKRKVGTDRTVSLEGRLYEVDANLIGQSVTIRYDPARPAAPVIIVHEGKVIERARQVDLYANCFVKRNRGHRGPQADRAPDVPTTRLSMRTLSTAPAQADTHDDSDDDCGEPI